MFSCIIYFSKNNQYKLIYALAKSEWLYLSKEWVEKPNSDPIILKHTHIATLYFMQRAKYPSIWSDF